MVSPLSFHSVCSFHGAPSVFIGRRPGGRGLWGDLDCKGDKKGQAGKGREKPRALEKKKKTNKKLAVECFLLTIVNS